MHKDQVYIEALLENNAAKIDEIYQRFSKKIIDFVKKNSGTETDAKDIFQEALISIYKKALSTDFILTCPFEAYLYMVCRGKWLNNLKSSTRKNETITDINGYTYNETAEELSNSAELHEEKMKLLENKFSLLGDSCKNILSNSWKGIALDKVASELNISYAYVRKKKSECVKKLMELIKQDALYKKLKTI